jgi:hypothetical protein
MYDYNGLKGVAEKVFESMSGVKEQWKGHNWLDDAENDLQDLKLKRLSQNANNIREYSSVVKKA